MLLLLACTAPDSADTATPLPSACGTTPEGMAVHLPEDDAAHPDVPLEWWYWTGHLYDGDTPVYGFQYVVFLLDYGMGPHSMVHRALTDLRADTFRSLADYGDAPTQLPTTGFEFSLFDSTAVGGDGHDELAYTVDGLPVSLTMDGGKDPVYHHGDGYTEYDAGGNTYYYSRTRMAVSATVAEEELTGEGWFDHQWGELLTVSAVGWDWYALQLEDGRELMLFLVHDGEGVTVAGGSMVGADCRTTEVPADQITVTPRGEWTSEVTGCTYPVGWDLQVGEEQFGLTQAMDDQEIDGGYTAYWEGDAAIDGTAGRAYVELNGYCD